MANIITVELKGVDAVRRALGAAFAQAEREIAVAVTDFGTDLKEEVVYSMKNEAKTGRVYTHRFVTIGGRAVPIERRSRPHQASAPGQAPASDTGSYAPGGIYVEPDGPSRVVVGSRLAYAAYLEFGTQKIAPRPAWLPAVEKLRPEFMAQIETILARAMNAK